jgi:hypothetical protein
MISDTDERQLAELTKDPDRILVEGETRWYEPRDPRTGLRPRRASLDSLRNAGLACRFTGQEVDELVRKSRIALAPEAGAALAGQMSGLGEFFLLGALERNQPDDRTIAQTLRQSAVSPPGEMTQFTTSVLLSGSPRNPTSYSALRAGLPYAREALLYAMLVERDALASPVAAVAMEALTGDTRFVGHFVSDPTPVRRLLLHSADIIDASAARPLNIPPKILPFRNRDRIIGAPRRGELRRRDDLVDWFLWNLETIFCSLTERKPGISIGAPGSKNEGKPDGPFLRFCEYGLRWACQQLPADLLAADAKLRRATRITPAGIRARLQRTTGCSGKYRRR